MEISVPLTHFESYNNHLPVVLFQIRLPYTK